MGRALVALVTVFVAVCAALPVALNTYRPPHEPEALRYYSITFVPKSGCSVPVTRMVRGHTYSSTMDC